MPEAPEVPEATRSVSQGLGACRRTLQVIAQEVALEVGSRAPSTFTEPPEPSRLGETFRITTSSPAPGAPDAPGARIHPELVPT